MATLSRYPFVTHLRAEPNQYILHYAGGRLVAQGAGLAYWFLPLSASVAQVPVEDIETTFMVQERTRDLQDVNAQVTLRYRCAQPERAAARVNFAISLQRGLWLEQPLERLASFWAQRAARPARSCLVNLTIAEAARSGAERVETAVHDALTADPELADMGLALVSVHVVRVAPNAEVEKALQTPEREAIQQKADEASFARRALAVEKERAIQENELTNKIELARVEEQLIAQNGANALAKVRHENEAEQARAEGAALAVQARAAGDAKAREALNAVDLAHEAARVGVYNAAPPAVAWAMAAQNLTAKIQNIQHLNVTPDLLGSTFQALLRQEKPTP